MYLFLLVLRSAAALHNELTSPLAVESEREGPVPNCLLQSAHACIPTWTRDSVMKFKYFCHFNSDRTLKLLFFSLSLRIRVILFSTVEKNKPHYACNIIFLFYRPMYYYWAVFFNETFCKIAISMLEYWWGARAGPLCEVTLQCDYKYHRPAGGRAHFIGAVQIQSEDVAFVLGVFSPNTAADKTPRSVSVISPEEARLGSIT